MKPKDRDTLPGPATKRTVGTQTSVDQASIDLGRGFRLTAIAGPASGGSGFAAQQPRVLVGTHPSCDLVVADPTVSRFHFEILVDGERALIRDVGSTNGTRVDGVAIAAAYLAPNAVIEAGDTRLRFTSIEEAVTVATSKRTRFGTLVAASPAMARVFAVLERAAASDATVLVEGETGTGKEAVAESIHRESSRKDGPFVIVDCAALPAELLESELFGHEKGAFTGAIAAREGAFEAADGGTLFLDEIGELSADLQPKLLRVLERREIKRVGKTKYKPVDVRVVAATNRDLRVEVNAQRFRSDLYYRLAVVEVRLPALRERPDDLPVIVQHLLNELDAPAAKRAALSSAASLAELARHAWPGNVRELRNWLERSIALDERIAPDSSRTSGEREPTIDLSRPLKEAREKWLQPLERRYLEGLLAREKGNITAAARAAGVDRITFYRLLWRHGLRER